MDLHRCRSAPADFAKIPEGSAKDNVLSSVAGFLTVLKYSWRASMEVPSIFQIDRHRI